VTKDNFFTVGAPLPNVPKHNVGAFAHYEVQEGPLTGLGATLGVSYNSNRNGVSITSGFIRESVRALCDRR